MDKEERIKKLLAFPFDFVIVTAILSTLNENAIDLGTIVISTGFISFVVDVLNQTLFQSFGLKDSIYCR